jgi:hypothetical protein
VFVKRREKKEKAPSPAASCRDLSPRERCGVAGLFFELLEKTNKNLSPGGEVAAGCRG